MPTYHLPATPEVSAALAQGYPVGDRLRAVAIAAGYVIGEGDIQVYADGSVVIDCDRDPSAQWATFDPLTMLTPAEEAAQQEQAARRQLAEQVALALDLLDGAATLAQTRTILARLIRYLVRTGAIGP